MMKNSLSLSVRNIMHLKSCSKLLRSELCLDATRVPASSQRSVVVGQQGALRRACSSNYSNFSSGRLLLSTFSTNAALQPVPSELGCENDTLRLCQSTAEDVNATLDIWTVIKPGHIREKIAIFASGGHADGAEGNVRLSSSSWVKSPAKCMNFTDTSGLARGTKAKGSWEENGSAKRRRRSGSNQNQDLQLDRRTRVLDTRQHAPQVSSYRSDLTRQSAIEQVGSEVVTVDKELEHKVSVVDMVAFLEQRVSEQQPDSKPLLALRRSSTIIAPSGPLTPDTRGDEPESIRVSEMVAKLESECLRRKVEGDLSRSNSLKRTSGRVLHATEHSSVHSQLMSPMSSLSGARAGRQNSCSETTPALAVTTPPSPPHTVSETASSVPPPEEAEPLPGLLFWSPSMEAPRWPSGVSLGPDTGSQAEKRMLRRAEPGGEGASPLSRHVSTSQDFLEIRQRLQQLLAPQPYLAVLPHHLLVKIFLLLPTQSLVALKCTCHYFKFVIENYGVRPADSLWVSDPRYRDDPCKQCKKRYDRGDVSLCRWHHKPFCQALPYGPGYWMCCHGPRRDTPGCNVGLHDNRWVPPFHSINMPLW